MLGIHQATLGIEGLVRSLAADFSASGLRVNAIAPGLMRTPATERLLSNEAAAKGIAAQYPLGRHGEAADAAALAALLLSDAGSWISGQVIGLDGGFGASFLGPGNYGPGEIPFASETADGIPKHQQWTLEFRLESQDSGPLSWQAGLFFFHEDYQIESFSYGSKIVGPGRVHVSSMKQENRVAALPARDTTAVLSALAPDFPQFVAAPTVLATSLNHMNAMLYVPTMLMNAGRIESTDGAFEFYRDGVTPAVARVMEDLDGERMAVSRALGAAAHIRTSSDRAAANRLAQGAASTSLLRLAPPDRPSLTGPIPQARPASVRPSSKQRPASHSAIIATAADASPHAEGNARRRFVPHSSRERPGGVKK